MLLLGMFVFEELAGIGSGAVLLSNMVYFFLRQRPELAQTLQGEWWIAGTFFSLAGVLSLQYVVLDLGDHKVNQFYYNKIRYWIAIIIGYVSVFFMGYSTEYLHYTVYWERIFGANLLQILIKVEPTKIGIAGAFFCGFWYVRENILMNIERNKRKIGDGK